MQGYYTYPSDGGAPSRRPRIAVVTQGVKLGDETRGYTRFRFLSELLAREGMDVDLITSTFQHWDKAQRDTTRACYQGLPYRIRFVYEPGYKRNLDLVRINSHRVFARNLRGLFASRFADNPRAYDLIYSEIPPNDMALTCAQVAHKHGIPYVADINDLWPEAMRMAVDVPVLSDVAFAPFARDARRTYQLISAAVGTSDEYANRPAADRDEPYEKRTVYVGNQLSVFDAGAREHAAEVVKPADEIWVTYAGMLGASYDIATLIDAATLAAAEDPRIRVKLLGDGPDRAALEARAASKGASAKPHAASASSPAEPHAASTDAGAGVTAEPHVTSASPLVEFLGYAPYDLMAAYLVASDITVNSLVKSAAQSIVTKIGDYLAAGIPMVNTGSSPEFRAKVESDGFGVNVPAEDAPALARALVDLAADPARRAAMGQRARTIAEQQFDQERSYQTIVALIRTLLQ